MITEVTQRYEVHVGSRLIASVPLIQAVNEENIMANFICGRGALRRFLLGPLCVLYYYHYKNYLRTGRTEQYAKGWASGASSIALVGPYIWAAVAIQRSLGLIDKVNFGNIMSDKSYTIMIVTIISIYMILAYMLDWKRVTILNELDAIRLPSIPIVLAAIVFFALPLLLIVAGLGKYHFLLATVLMFAYYTLFHFSYFDCLIKRLPSSAPPRTSHS